MQYSPTRIARRAATDLMMHLFLLFVTILILGLVNVESSVASNTTNTMAYNAKYGHFLAQ